MKAFNTLTGHYLSLDVDDVDTDQIVPARFLKMTDKAGLADVLFHDWRYRSDGTPRHDFILNSARAKEAEILIAGDNFGCGSSREHAPWALLAFGLRVVISSRFADIFRNNAIKNGLLPVSVSPSVLAALHRKARTEPAATLTVDLAHQQLTLPDGTGVTFPIDGFSKRCLLQGLDQLGYLLELEPHILEFERTHPPRVDTHGAR